MFGGTGLFYHDAMFVLIDDQSVYLRGGGYLDHVFEQCGCKRFKQIKKTVRVIVNYYDVTELFYSNRQLFCLLESSAKAQSRIDRASVHNKMVRLRDLPNMRLTLERMIKKAGIEDVEQFREVGALEAYLRVQSIYGQNVDETVLFKFAGAIDGVHWQLLSDERKSQLALQMGTNNAEESKRPCQ
jgi:DNA transformation protein